MADKTMQDEFLNDCVVHDTPVTVFLVNGIKLQGKVAMFDTHSILLQRDHHKQLVYKHAISTVMPSVQP